MPSTDLRYSWDAATSTWDTVKAGAYLYYPNTNLIASVTISEKTNGWSLSERLNLQYAPQGWITLVDNEDFDGVQFSTYLRTITTYDNQGNRIEYQVLDRNTGNLQTSYWTRNTMTFDSMGRITRDEVERYKTAQNAWEPVYADDFFWGSAIGWDSAYHYLYDNGNWLLDSRTVNVSWNDFAAMQFNHYDKEDLVSGAWLPNQRFEYTWSANNSREVVELRYNSSANAYEPYSRQVHSFDLWDNRLVYNAFDYDAPSASWVQDVGYRYQNIYDGQNRLLETIEEIYDDANNTWANHYRIEYLGLALSAPSPLPASSASWHPQPAGQSAFLQLDGPKPGPVNVQLFDLQGRLLRSYSQQKGSGSAQLEFELGLAEGMYLYRVEAPEGKFAGKLLVR